MTHICMCIHQVQKLKSQLKNNNLLVSILDTWKRTTLIGSATSKPCQLQIQQILVCYIFSSNTFMNNKRTKSTNLSAQKKKYYTKKDSFDKRGRERKENQGLYTRKINKYSHSNSNKTLPNFHSIAPIFKHLKLYSAQCPNPYNKSEFVFLYMLSYNYVAQITM